MRGAFVGAAFLKALSLLTKQRRCLESLTPMFLRGSALCARRIKRCAQNVGVDATRPEQNVWSR
jgi:hypothetical protein